MQQTNCGKIAQVPMQHPNHGRIAGERTLFCKTTGEIAAKIASKALRGEALTLAERRTLGGSALSQVQPW